MNFLAVFLQAAFANGQIVNILFITGMIAIFYFFMIRPQQQKQKKQKAFTDAIKKGDSVVTIGGLHGKVSAVEGNTIVLEVDKGVKMRFEKFAISFENSQQMTKVETEAK